MQCFLDGIQDIIHNPQKPYAQLSFLCLTCRYLLKEKLVDKKIGDRLSTKFAEELIELWIVKKTGLKESGSALCRSGKKRMKSIKCSIY